MAREMVDSGISWIGKIPANWIIHPVYYYFSERKHKNSMGREKNLLSLSYGNIIRKNIEQLGGLIPESYNTYNIIENGDIVIRPTDLQNDKRSLRTGLAKEHGIITSAYITLKPHTGVNSAYFHYLLHTYDIMKVFYNMGNGVRQSLNFTEFSKLMIFEPPIEEQKKIADFLDEKCAEIDSLIADIQREIDKLERLKRSVITEAVTKGLDKNAEMKDSGVKWIGKIPNDWTTSKILYVLSMSITDGPHETPMLYADGVPFVSAEAISFGNGKIDFSHIRGYISEDYYKICCKKYIPKIDDIYMIKSGATTGKIAIVDTDIKFTIWSPLAVFRSNPNVIIPKYLYYSLYSTSFQRQVHTNWSYGTQQNIGMRVLEKLKICLPNLIIQSQIVEFLDNICTEFDTVLSEKNRQLEILQKLKKSVIYEYVTGKKEVK